MEAGGRRQCESPLFLGSHEDNQRHREAPFPLTLGRSPGLGASCSQAKESHRESPRLASGWQAPRTQGCPACWSQGLFAPEALPPTWGRTREQYLLQVYVALYRLLMFPFSVHHRGTVGVQRRRSSPLPPGKHTVEHCERAHSKGQQIA